MKINNLSADQLRGAVNLSDSYDGWVRDAQVLESGRLRWKTVAGKDYLYRLRKGSDTGSSLGVRSEETQAMYEEGRATELRHAATEKNMLVKARLYRTLGLPVIDTFAARVLRALDVAGLLGDSVRVIGSGALPAYELEANARISGDLLATEDFDMAWVDDRSPSPLNGGLLAAIKQADTTWTVVEDRSFQLRNRAGEMMDIVVAESLAADYPRHERLRALPTSGQEYLLGGTPVSQVVADARGYAARIVAPDPRLFALHKFYLSERPGRQRKRGKDIGQAEALMTLIHANMPHYPFDEAFEATLPTELGEHLEKWRSRQAAPASRPPGP